MLHFFCWLHWLHTGRPLALVDTEWSDFMLQVTCNELAQQDATRIWTFYSLECCALPFVDGMHADLAISFPFLPVLYFTRWTGNVRNQSPLDGKSLPAAGCCHCKSFAPSCENR